MGSKSPDTGTGDRGGRRSWSWLLIVALAGLALAAAVPLTTRSPAVCVDCASSESEATEEFQFAVFGDYPYGEKQRRQLPQLVEQINGDPEVDMVFHLGDIKGAGPCRTSYYRGIKAEFDRFRDPLVYTFGDNEWADCWRPGNGAYDPLERLATLRSTFVPQPGLTLGGRLPVASQAEQGLPENVSFVRGGVSFAVFHAVGSANGLAPWSGRSKPTPKQRAEVLRRSGLAADLIRRAFDTAHRDRLETVVLLTQADMFPGPPDAAQAAAYRAIVRTLAREAARFPGPVYLFNGDSHRYVLDQPLSADTGWAATYGVPVVTNLTRVTVDGDTLATNYLRVDVRRYSDPALTWTTVPIDGP